MFHRIRNGTTTQSDALLGIVIFILAIIGGGILGFVIANLI